MKTAANIRQLPPKVERLLLPLSIVVVLAGAAIFYANSDLVRRSRAEVQRFDQAGQTNDALLSALKDVEAGQRGYLLTGDGTYLTPYRSAKAKLPGLISTLSGQLRAPDQLERLRKLRPLIQVKIAEVDATLLVRDHLGPGAALAIIRSNRGQQSMDAIRRLSAEIKDAAQARLLIQSRLVDGLQNRMRAFILLTCVLLTALLGFPLWLIQLASRRREQLINQVDAARMQLHVTLASIGDGVITADPQGAVTFLNSVAERLTGWTLAQASGQTMETVFPVFREDTGEAMENPARQAIRERRAIELANHACLIRRDGTKLPIDDSAAPILDSEDHLNGVVMVFRDMSTRKRVAESLKRWEHIFQHAGFGMAIITPGDKPIIEQVNPAFALMHGYEPAEMQGKPYSMVVTPQVWEAKAKALAGASGDHVLAETMHFRRDGTEFPALSDITIVRDQLGQIAYCVGYYSDISDRRRAEQELRASEERYRTTADSLPQLVWTSTADGATEYLNNRWKEDTGLTLEAAGAQGWAYFLDSDDREKCLEMWKRSLTSGETFQAECRFRRGENEKPRWYTCRAVPIRAADGRILRWFGSCTDIHEQREATDLLRQANEALKRSNLDLEQFAYAASHDLQEPLRMVVIYSQLLKEEYGEALIGPGKTYLDFAVDGALRMENLLKDLLSYARAGAPDEHSNETADSALAFTNACMNLAALIQQSNAQVSCGVLPKVRMPEIYLTQIFQNLLSNSLKYTRPGAVPVISVEAARQGGMCLFSVKDNGIGVAAEHQGQIFRVFRRLHGQDVPGTGIGLALCQKLVERSGGTIWVDSKIGQGSVFSFTARPSSENPHA